MTDGSERREVPGRLGGDLPDAIIQGISIKVMQWALNSLKEGQYLYSLPTKCLAIVGTKKAVLADRKRLIWDSNSVGKRKLCRRFESCLSH